MAFVSIQFKIKQFINREREQSLDNNALKRIHKNLQVDELLILPFNDSIQVYIYTEKEVPDQDDVLKQVAKELNYSVFVNETTLLTEQEAVTDFIKKANGIVNDGNPMQLIKAFTEDFYKSKEARTIGPVLQRLFQRSIWIHEKVRMNTGYFKIATTVSGVFCELAEKIYGSLKGLNVYISGDSLNNTALVNELQRHEVRRFYFNGSTAGFENLKNAVNPALSITATKEFVSEADILIVNQEQKDIINEDILNKRMTLKNNEPFLILCETNAPQKESLARKFYNIFWYNLADLKQLVKKNSGARDKIFNGVEPWINKEISTFYDWLSSDSRYNFMNIVGRSAKMQELFELISRISQTDITVLIQGDSGTGKELVARAIHKLSKRSEKPFIAVNCGAIPENLLESELFGHIKGAFTGAINNKDGLFSAANHGTILLDEIGELPQHLQVKILRFLQEGDIKPVGSSETMQVDVRVIAATNRNLQQMVDQDTFRSDLYYRLNVILLELPPLRERKEDIVILANSFLKKYAVRFKKDVQGFSSQALQVLQDYNWPGNVRELENAVEHAVALCLGKQILQYELPSVTRYKMKNISNNINTGFTTLKEVEKKHILSVLEQTGWDYEKACDILAIGRTTLWRKLKEYGMSQN